MQRAAALGVALLCIPPAWAAAQPISALPSGTPLTFVSDATIDARTAHPGQRFRAHLQGDMLLGSAVLASSGAPASILIADVVPVAGVVELRIVVDRFTIKDAGDLPLSAAPALIGGLKPGDLLGAKTAGIVEVRADRTTIRVPLPFPLSVDAPNATFTARPFSTTAPVVPPRRTRSGGPVPTPTASPSPEDTTPAELRKPLVSPSPTTTPS